jgi:hypothetical protein
MRQKTKKKKAKKIKTYKKKEKKEHTNYWVPPALTEPPRWLV